MKNIKIFLTLALLLGVNITLFVNTDTANALTDEQQIACLKQWGDRGTGSSVPEGTKGYNEEAYLKSNCDKSDDGNCKIERYEDGSAINCMNPRTGEDDRGVDPTPPPPSVGTTDGGCAGIETSIIDCNSNGGNPIISVLLQIINFLAVGVGLAVVGGIIWGGITYSSSNGDPSKVQQAKLIIVNAIIGLLLFIFLYSIVNFLVPGGLFG